MIDAKGYRANVGIVLLNDDGQVFWGRRIGMNGWQFPQGGIKPNESAEQAMYRELREETGLDSHHVEVIGCTRRWLRYRLPKRYIRYHQRPLCIGQKQIWYVLRLQVDEKHLRVDRSDSPEFDTWCWMDYWDPIRYVISFKRSVYSRALSEIAEILATVDRIELPRSPWSTMPRQSR